MKGIGYPCEGITSVMDFVNTNSIQRMRIQRNRLDIDNLKAKLVVSSDNVRVYSELPIKKTFLLGKKVNFFLKDFRILASLFLDYASG